MECKAIASRLKRSSEYIEKVLAHSQQHSEKETEWPIDAMSLALQLSNELASWPRLDAGNLHPFRLKVQGAALRTPASQESRS